MSGAAQRDEMIEGLQATGTDGSALKQAVAERLASHRSRRAAAWSRESAKAAQAGQQEIADSSRRIASKVREAVAARYEQSVSYREFLAAEAERALQQAQAEAEVATRNARAVAEAQIQLMKELAQWEHPATPRVEEMVAAPSIVEAAGTSQAQHTQIRGELAHALADIALGAKELIREDPPVREGGLTVCLYEDVAPPMAGAFEPREFEPREVAGRHELSVNELRQLEEEIEFRMAPEFAKYAVEADPIPGNLIEFPRQLVASRKARPRLAEGPLREDAPAMPQLRIFEVEAEQISAEPVMEASAAPEWQSLLLEGSKAVAASQAPQHAQLDFTHELHTAPLERRLMATAVDCFCVSAALVCFAAVAVEITGGSLRMLPKPLLIASAVGLAGAMMIGYQLLFFSLSGYTPGMRWARIGLCTFGDRNPSRKAMRRRVFATLLAVCPLGLGLAWAALDEERLGWHDRMSRMYQRAY